MALNEQTKINLGRLITAQRVLVAPEGLDKDGLIETLVRMACRQCPRLDPAEVTAQVLEREKGISTTLDTGLAIPHARVEGLDDFVAALAVLPVPVSEERHNKSIRVMFLFLSPDKPAFFQKHLQVLAALAETFQPGFIQELLTLNDPQAVAERLSR